MKIKEKWLHAVYENERLKIQLLALRKELSDLRNAVSPAREEVSTPEYYIGVATRMRTRELQIKPVEKRVDPGPAD